MDYATQIRTFAALAIQPERIANILGLKGTEREEVISLDTYLPGDPYNSAYLYGNAVGEYNIDAELAKQAEQGDIDSIESLETRKKERTHLDLKRKLFGI